MTVLIIVLVGQLTYLQVVDANRLANDPHNVRKFLRDFNRPRGEILTTDGQIVAQSLETNGELKYHARLPADRPLRADQRLSVVRVREHRRRGELRQRAHGAGHAVQARQLRLDSRQATPGTSCSRSHSPLSRAAATRSAARRARWSPSTSQTGEVLAMYSNPSFDPNPLAGHDTSAVNVAFFLLNNDPAKPALARSYRERFAPGSTFKVVTTAAALDARHRHARSTVRRRVGVPAPADGHLRAQLRRRDLRRWIAHQRASSSRAT